MERGLELDNRICSKYWRLDVGLINKFGYSGWFIADTVLSLKRGNEEAMELFDWLRGRELKCIDICVDR